MDGEYVFESTTLRTIESTKKALVINWHTYRFNKNRRSCVIQPYSLRTSWLFQREYYWCTKFHRRCCYSVIIWTHYSNLRRDSGVFGEMCEKWSRALSQSRAHWTQYRPTYSSIFSRSYYRTLWTRATFRWDKAICQWVNVMLSQMPHLKKPNADLVDVKNYRPIFNLMFK